MTNLFVKNADIKATEMIVTVQKIMSETRDIFGIEKYLTFGVRPFETIIRSSSAKAQLDDLEA